MKKMKAKIKSIWRMSLVFIMITFFVAQSVTTVSATQSTLDDNASVTADTDSDASDILGIKITTGDGNASLSGALQIMLVLTVIALCPSILIMVTSFTRILIVMHFTRAAVATQTAPPNQVLVGISLFLTFFIMSPVFSQVNENAIQPFSKGEITQEQALDEGLKPIRKFMLDNVKDEDLDSMASIAGIESISSKDEIPTNVLIPAFIISELRIAFWIGFLIYLPFVVIDMVVASTLMSMGMMMLPPTTISMPFKILLFVLADGWNLIIVNLIKTFVV
ncbi:flagellar type III secretion system pore protein FliP [Lachnospiraceae bacterium HCP1S3_C3]|nr:flagellar type III secretion system pore protein FliP [Lachnospiraceae bacterium]MDD6857515.1 flagellar type III secretion system pore protein FliP [Lachnospiraceae bacterium]